MKAVINTTYGPPEVLRIEEVNKPVPKDDEVLVKVHVAGLNRTDTAFRKPDHFINRLFFGLRKPKIHTLGTELSGRIEAVGKNVSSFKEGDAVFGLNTFKFGTHAEYVCVTEKKAIAPKPVNISFEEAAGVCDGMFLAYAMIKKIDFKTKPKILINGASGSIGSASVQFAKHFGAEITAVCNTKNMDLIKSLGAHKVIDYTKEDFTQLNEKFDIILDTVGKSSFFKCKKIMKSNAVYFSSELGYMSQNIYLAIFTPIFSRKKVKFPIPKDTKEDVLFFKKLIEAGNYKAVIDRIYTLDQIVEATKYVETGEKTGNVVIKIIDEL